MVGGVEAARMAVVGCVDVRLCGVGGGFLAVVLSRLDVDHLRGVGCGGGCGGDGGDGMADVAEFSTWVSLMLPVAYGLGVGIGAGVILRFAIHALRWMVRDA